MSIKKAYAEIVAVLEANKDKPVSSILDQVIALASAKGNRSVGSTSIKAADGTTVAIFDYYFKRWMPLVGPKAVEFGVKANTPTGFNSMSKEGVSHWTKQQRLAKQAGADLLQRVASGEVKPSEIAAEQARIEEERQMIVPTEMGYEDQEGVIKYLKKNGVELAA